MKFLKQAVITVAVCVAPALAYVLVNITQEALAASSDRYYLTGASNQDSSWAATTGGTKGATWPRESCDVFFDGNGNNAYASAASHTWRSATFAAAYTANATNSAKTMTTKYGVSQDGPGTYHWGSGLVVDSAGATVHVGSGVGTQTGTSCAITWNGTSGVMDDDKGVIFKSLTLGANVILTNSGGATTTYSLAGTPLTMGGGDSLAVNRNITFTNSGGGAFAALTGTNKISGSAGVTFTTNGSVSNTMPAITTTCNSVNWNFTGTGATGTLTVSGAQSHTGQLRVFASGTIGKFTANTGNYAVSCGDFSFGVSTAGSCIGVLNCGSSAFTVTGLNGTTQNNGTDSINYQTSTWTNSGHHRTSPNAIVNPGTSVHTFTGADSVVSLNQRFYDITFTNASTGRSIIVDSLTTADGGDVTITDGVFASNSQPVNSGGDISINSNDSLLVLLAGTNWTTRNAGATVTVGTNVVWKADSMNLGMLKGGTLALGQNINVRSLYFGPDYGLTVTAGKKVTQQVKTAYSWSGVAGRDSLRSSVAGTKDTMVLPRVGDLDSNLYLKDQVFTTEVFICTTGCVDGTGNSGVMFAAHGNRWWIGAGTAWNDSSNWAIDSAGIGGAPLPDSLDTVRIVGTGGACITSENHVIAKLVHTGGTLNTSGDTLTLGSVTWGSGATHTTDAATLYRIADGATITTAGKAMPVLSALGSITINGAATIARLTMASASRDTATFGNGTYTFTALDSSDINGASGSVLRYTGGTWDIPADITVSYVEAQNCTAATGDQIIASNGTNTDGGGTLRWVWPAVATAIKATLARWDAIRQSVWRGKSLRQDGYR